MINRTCKACHLSLSSKPLSSSYDLQSTILGPGLQSSSANFLSCHSATPLTLWISIKNSTHINFSYQCSISNDWNEHWTFKWTAHLLERLLFKGFFNQTPIYILLHTPLANPERGGQSGFQKQSGRNVVVFIKRHCKKSKKY